MAASARATTRLLIATRAVRSIGQGALVVDFSLYLHALRWSAVEISGVLSAALLAGGALTLAIGPLSDRIGRRRFLLAYEAVQLLAALAALVTSNGWVLGAAGIVGGFGRGGNGAAGPFSPVEQAWLAQSVPASDRGRIYSRNAASGFVGMAVGALAAALPARLAPHLPGALAYRPLFALAAFCSLGCLALMARARDTEARGRHDRPVPTGPVDPAPDDRAVRQRENRLMLRLMLANLLNGAGVGVTGPFISYWFAVRFGEGPELIGPMMALGFLLSGVASFGTGRLAGRVGIVKAVVIPRMAGLVMLLALPFAPSFGLAATLYTLRTICNRGTTGVRSALSAGLVRPERRGLAASLSNVATQLPRAVGPLLTGVLFQAGMLTLPFVIGAAFQGAYLYVYERSFGRMPLE